MIKISIHLFCQMKVGAGAERDRYFFLKKKDIANRIIYI